MASQRYRRASEIGEFVYCQRAWWLHHVVGHEPENRRARQAGAEAHATHSETVRTAHWLRHAAIGLIGLALLLLLLWGLGWH